MNESLIECAGLRRVFASEVETLEILRGVDLSVAAGESVAITGASGSGKSTLLSILGGLDAPSEGTVRVGPWRLDRSPEARLSEYRASFVGFVFQFHYLLKDFTALENVMLPAFMRGVARREATEKARSALDALGLGSRLDHFPAQLSGGERQRAAIARALVNDPPLVLADEPTGNLDPASARQVEELLYGACAGRSVTLVLVTHDRGIAARADRRYTLADGELLPA
ncbi:MAG: ABC transporter ATP-binding protein [Spirochaetia bacterium]|nr:ABC transporter ATP-binding protein [Spirochaetia bacterium]